MAVDVEAGPTPLGDRSGAASWSVAACSGVGDGRSERRNDSEPAACLDGAHGPRAGQQIAGHDRHAFRHPA